MNAKIECWILERPGYKHPEKKEYLVIKEEGGIQIGLSDEEALVLAVRGQAEALAEEWKMKGFEPFKPIPCEIDMVSK